jgi:PAS domain S-box-containing protein
VPDDPSDHGDPTPWTGGDPLLVNSFQRQIEAMKSRIESLGHDPSTAAPEVFEALETTMEELHVAVEELRLTNEALRDSRAEVEDERRRYRDLFDLAPDAYILTDLQGVIREANLAASDQLNLDHRFLVGKPLVLFLPEEGRPAFRTEINRLRDEPLVAEYDVRLNPRRRPSFDATVRVVAVRDALGRPVALRWTIRDVSAKKRAEEKIRGLNFQLERQVIERSEQLESVLQTNERLLIKAHAAEVEATSEGRLFREIVDEVDAILWRADAATGRYTFVSRRAEELLGYPVARWLDDPDFWLERIHPEDRDFAAAYRRKYLRDGLDHESEYRVVAADGRAIWFREAVRVLANGPGGSAVLYGMMVNISRRKKVERQLYTAKGELASQLRDMTYLHDLGGRLAAARGLPATLDAVLSAAASLQGANLAMVLIREPGRDRPHLAGGLGLPDDFARSVVEGGLIPRVDSFEPLSIEDVEAEPEGSAWREFGRIAGFRAVAVVPLFGREGQPLGAIVTGFKAPYRMGDRQARLVEIYAEQAAEAIEAARLLDRLEEADRRKGEALAVVAAEMRTPLDAILAAAADKLDPNARSQIERQIRRLSALVDRLSGPNAAENESKFAHSSTNGHRT